MTERLHDLSHAIIAEVDGRNVENLEEVILYEHLLQLDRRLFCQTVSIIVLEGAQRQRDDALICTHRVKDVTEPDPRDLVRGEFQAN